jgi:glutathionylspermidine synthase
VHYELDEELVKRIEKATRDLTLLYYKAIDFVCENNEEFEKLGIPENLGFLAKKSWK